MVLIVALGIIGLVTAALLWNLAEIGSSRNPNLQPICGKCRKALPMTTWLPLSGLGTAWRCRSCGTRQTRVRLGWELAVAGYFGLLGWQWGDSRHLLFAAISAIPLLLILIIDLRGQVLYLNSIVFAFVVAGVLGFIDGPRALGSAMVGLTAGIAVAVAFFALARWVFRSMSLKVSSIGVGDIYIAAAVGAIVRGDGIVPALVIAVIAMIVASIGLRLVSQPARRRATTYGPYLCIGGLATLLI